MPSVRRARRSGPRQRLLIPEVLQTSGTDCGPACVKSVAGGFGRELSYARLRELCQTDVDGTSIDNLEDVFKHAGLGAHQLVVPCDQVLDPAAELLPVVAVFGRPGGAAHFVVLWRRVGNWVQVMNPASGRRWMHVDDVTAELYQHEMTIPTEVWASWARQLLRQPWLRQLRRMGIPHARPLVDAALHEPGAIAATELDGAIRLTADLLRARAIRGRGPAARFLGQLRAPGRDPATGELLRRRCFGRAVADGVRVEGAVVLRVRPSTKPRPGVDGRDRGLEAKSVDPLRAIAELITRTDKAVFVAAGFVTAMTLVLSLGEALVFRAVLAAEDMFAHPIHRALTLVCAVVLVSVTATLRLSGSSLGAWLGRRVEAAFRLRLFEVVRRLSPSYLQTRPLVDLAERAHNVHKLRGVPVTLLGLLRGLGGLVVTVGAITWVDRRSGFIAAVGATLGVVILTLLHKPVAAAEMKVRNRDAMASRLYLEAMVGSSVVAAHGGQKALAHEYERHLAHWGRARLGLLRLSTLQLGQSALLGFGLVAVIVLDFLHRDPTSGFALLVVYWAMMLPFFLAQVSSLATQAPDQINATARVLEPLGEARDPAPAEEEITTRYGLRGARVCFRGAAVLRSGQQVLRDIDLEIAPGEHVAVVGPSGSGKSTLVGTLTGWHATSSGSLLVDDRLLQGEHLESIRTQTAWIDPASYLWNTTLIDNVRLPHPSATGEELHEAFSLPDLYGSLGHMPAGLATQLGEGGGLLSGGEGQRVRAARAVLKRNVRLVLLDEPFRGLQRSARDEAIARLRRRFVGTTLLCVTHDIAQTQSFPRVVVIEHGRVVEDGPPAELLRRQDSRYAKLLAAGRRADEAVWGSPHWRRLWLDDGVLTEEARPTG